MFRKALGKRKKYLGFDTKQRKQLEQGQSIGRVASIHIHPFKSCRPVARESVRLTKNGLEFDRVVMAVNAKNVPVSQRMRPELARIDVDCSVEDNTVTLSPPSSTGLEPLRLCLTHVETDKESAEDIDMHGAVGKCVSFGREASIWINSCLTKLSGRHTEGYRLMCMLKGSLRKPHHTFARALLPNSHHEDGLLLGDLAPFSLVSQASLATLKREMPDAERRDAVDINCFRANVVIETSPELAFVEDHAATLQIGDYSMRVVGPTFRCVETTVDQKTGEAGFRKGLRKAEPLATLKQLRPGGLRFGISGFFPTGAGGSKGFAPLFGIYLGADDPSVSGTIRVGDEVTLKCLKKDPSIISKLVNCALLAFGLDSSYLL
ncbi:Molybdenum cofactor sulfurase [Hondaea fermentalgiana]|uniref:Molybdenum cofactor sulfurase n=1 Tax=Hondaea fermentalgiana TaxID=2315210 RepID=A0A2R5G5M9_9STRA|nr:Molybdenum cofactor sulfurase [Hondaea fermentalgiana]|eukprot:GBG26346.1 Molybdenum cofactor sulfurase [Hondaea fermentalgiana]